MLRTYAHMRQAAQLTQCNNIQQQCYKFDVFPPFDITVQKHCNIERGKYVKLISPPQAAAPGSVRGVSKSPADARKPKQSRLVQHGIAESLASCTPYDRKSKRWKDITQAVTICLAKDMMPIQTVEKEGFKQLVKKLDPRYTLPKRKYFSKTALPDMYEEYREKVEASLSSADFYDYYKSTTDLWSSRTTEPYLSLTVHYINSDWDSD